MKLNAFAGIAGAPTLSAPIMGYVTTGVFSVTNPVSGAVYTANLVSGSGTATWDATYNRFTLSAVDARFSVTVGWSPSSPQSAPDYMERARYQWTADTRTWGTCGGVWVGGECTSAHSVTPPCGEGSGCGAGCDNPSWCCDSRTPAYYVEPYTCQTGGSAPVFIPLAGYIDSGAEWYKLS